VKTWLVLLSALLWVSSASMVHAGNNVWTSLGPEGGKINALALDPTTPTTLYAGTGGGVFKSPNGGSSWSATGLTTLNVNALALDPTTPTTLYAGTSGGGVFKSTDGGSSWSAVNTGLPTAFVYSSPLPPPLQSLSMRIPMTAVSSPLPLAPAAVRHWPCSSISRVFAGRTRSP